jgi:hypothetical protein
MAAQVRLQGRHLGGRPPYGYRLADAGPHPNDQHAAWGRRLLRLDPDLETAPHVQWIFAQRLVGNSTAGIARTLNALGIPSPSAHDPDRNSHRHRAAWTLRTVAAILANPRYTGRQVWKRQSIDHHEIQPGDKTSRPAGCKPTRSWNPRDQWVISPPDAHPALISEDTFLQAQQITAIAVPDDANPDRYQLTGLVICGLCGRRTEGHWARGATRPFAGHRGESLGRLTHRDLAGRAQDAVEDLHGTVGDREKHAVGVGRVMGAQDDGDDRSKTVTARERSSVFTAIMGGHARILPLRFEFPQVGHV